MTTEDGDRDGAEDNANPTGTDGNAEHETEPTGSETDEGGEGDGSNVTPREKFLRDKLRQTEKERDALRKVEEERRKAELSETDRLREELAEKEKTVSALLRKSIAAEHGLPAELADRLAGATEEELTEDAKRLAELVKAPKPKTPPAGDAGVGVPGGDGEIDDPVALARKWGRRGF